MTSERFGSDAFGYFCMGRHFRFFASLHRECGYIGSATALPDSCCVFGCHNRRSQGSNIRFYSIQAILTSQGHETRHLSNRRCSLDFPDQREREARELQSGPSRY